jgi:hypothetical protein
VEGFKSNPKMKSDVACYKEGGSVYKSRTHKEDPKEASEDKALVKKGIRQHEAAKHKGEEKTDVKLKQGGRCKKEGGNVRKYKAGGPIGMKKDKQDKKEIAQTKKAKPGKADTPSAAKGKKKESPKTDNKPAKKTMTASMVGSLPPVQDAASAALSMPEDQPIEMMADGGMAGMAGMGQVSDAERQMLMQAMKGQPRRRRTQNAAFGPLGQQALGAGQMQPPAGGMGAQMGGGMGGMGGMGAQTGGNPMVGSMTPPPMGGGAPMGNTQNIMRGLQALGQYAEGGDVC